MKVSIFYSWQSDLPSKTNRSFIEDAIKKALKSINKDIKRGTISFPNSGSRRRLLRTISARNIHWTASWRDCCIAMD